MTATPETRTLAIVDVDNLLMGTHLAGIDHPVLADQLWAQLESRCGGKKLEVRAYASEHTRDVAALAEAFSARGYDFKVCESLTDDSRKSSVDPHMMVDTLVTVLGNDEAQWGAVALVTGDTDFVPLLQHIRSCGVETLVLAPAHCIPRALKAAATESQPLWDPKPIVVETPPVVESPSIDPESVPALPATVDQPAPATVRFFDAHQSLGGPVACLPGENSVGEAGCAPAVSSGSTIGLAKAQELLGEWVNQSGGKVSLASTKRIPATTRTIVASTPPPVRARETTPDDVWRLIGGPLTRAGVQFPSLGSLELGDALAEVSDVSRHPGKYPAKALANRLKARNLGAGAEATTLLTLCSFGHQVLKTRPQADPTDVAMCFVEGVLAIARGIGGIDTSMRSRDALLRWVFAERTGGATAMRAVASPGPALS